VQRLLLNKTETAEIRLLVDRTLSDNQPWDPVRFADHAATVAQLLPVGLRQFLTHIRTIEAEVAVVSGLPISPNLMPTPIGWELTAKTGAGESEELLLLLCGTLLGEPFAWADQQAGRLVHDVCPEPGMERSATSASSQSALSLHTEDAYHSCRGDYVSLLCLRNPDAVGTTFVRVESLRVPQRVRRILAADRYRFDVDDSHVGNNAFGHAAEIGPILFGPEDRPYMRIDLDVLAAARPGDIAAEAAMQTITTLLLDGRERFVLAPGDAMFIDNYRVVHGRDPFNPRYDGNDRWLKRVNLSRDLRRAFVTTRTRSRILP
jgi:L-asparagine oxygenase